MHRGLLPVLLLIASMVGCGGRGGRDDSDVDAGPRPDTDAPPGDCPGGGWCRSRSGIPGNLLDVWASSPSDVWAISSSALWRYDGTSWRDVGAPFTGGMQSVWGTSPTDVWAGGELGVIWHWDGATWTEETMSGSTVATVSFTRASDGVMWGLGRSGEILRRDADGWRLDATTFTPSGSYGEVITECEGRLWAASLHAQLRDGGAWWQIGLEFADRPRAITTIAGEVYFGGNRLYQWDGAQLRSRQAENAPLYLRAVAGSGPDDVYAGTMEEGILHWDGSTWTPLPGVTATEVSAIAVTAPGEVTYADVHGTLHRWSAGTETVLARPPGLFATPFDSLVVVSRDLAYMSHLGGIYRWTPVEGGWIEDREGTPGGTAYMWLASSAPLDLWLAAANAVWRFDGTTLTPVPMPTLPDGENLIAIWGTSTSDVWVAGLDVVMRYDGSAWREVGGAPPALDVVPEAYFGGVPGEVFLGRNGVARFDGLGFREIAYGPYAFSMGCTPDGLLAASSEPLQLYRLAADAAPEAIGEAWDGYHTYDAWFGSPTDVWAVGFAGDFGSQIARREGDAWLTSVDRSGDGINAVWGFPGGEAFAVGGSTIFHRPAP